MPNTALSIVCKNSRKKANWRKVRHCVTCGVGPRKVPKSLRSVLLPFEATVPEGFTASVAASLSGTTVNLTPTSTIAAYEPVLIQGEGSLSLTATDAPIAATDGALLCGGLLQGTYKTIPAPIGSYVLQKQQDVIGFYQVSDSQPTVKPFRAFLNVPPSDVKAYTLSFDDATGIKEIENGEDPLSPFNKWSMVNG